MWMKCMILLFNMSGTRTFKGLGNPDDIVSQHRIYTEAVDKELSHLQINNVFQLRAASLSVTAPKVTSVDPRKIDKGIREHLDTREGFIKNQKTTLFTGTSAPSKPVHANDMEVVVDGINRMHLTPYEKVKIPETSSQEIGWCTVMDSDKNGTTWNPNGVPSTTINDSTKRFWYRPKGQTDVTKFAEAYTMSMHKNPFYRDGPAPPAPVAK